MLSTSDKRLLSAHFATSQGEIPDWLKEDGTAEYLSHHDVMRLIEVLGGALVRLSAGLTDVNLIIEAIKTLYNFVRGDRKVAVAKLSPHERILAMVFDAYVDGRRGVLLERTAALSGLTIEEAIAVFEDLEKLKMVRRKEESWIFFPRDAAG